MKIIEYLKGFSIMYKLKRLKGKVMPSKSYTKMMQEIEIRRAFYSNFIKEGDLCFDVGANVGNRILPLLALKANIVAVEPQETCVRILKAKFGKKVVIINKGLDENEEIKDFYMSNAYVLSSFNKDWIDSVKKTRFKDARWNIIKKIEMTTLDNLITKYGIPKFIKIDVEGYELSVLKGLSTPIKVISFEYTTPEQTNLAIDCIKRIAEINPEIECNYSVGESMHLALENYIDKDKMLDLIETKGFIATSFGDIYIKSFQKII